MRQGSTYHPSILNTILGPITLGPSSSHLTGPVKLGLLVRSILGGTPSSVEIVFNEGGSLAGTYRGHRTDCALVAGLLGLDADNTGIPEAPDTARERGINISFRVEPINNDHPNAIEFRARDRDGHHIMVTGMSVGGGAVRIDRVNHRTVLVDGQHHSLLAVADGESSADMVKTVVLDGFGASVASRDRETIVFNLPGPLSEQRLTDLVQLSGLRLLRPIEPVFLPQRTGASSTPLFETGARVLDLAAESGETLASIALRYESARLGYSEREIRQHIRTMVMVMRRAIDRGLSEDLPLSGGIVNQGGKRLMEALSAGRTISRGTLPRAAAYAMAVNEVSASLGLIVAAPTAGACGVIPGAILSAAEELGSDRDEILIDALLTAAAVGVVFAQRATFLAELCGCQVETGAAAAMAAAALVELIGGTPRQALAAASITLQNILGMECDPVGGLMEVPCINRNALGAVNALISADIVLAGVDSVIPLDEAIDVVYETGRFRPVQCSGTGGLAVTPTGRLIADRMHGCGRDSR